MKKPNFISAKQYALQLLAEKLPTGLYYHSLFHTRDEVAPAAAHLSVCQDLSLEDAVLLHTAVYFHDLGFTVQRTDHERVSATLAGDVLPTFGYSLAQIEAIQSIIMATNLSRPAANLLEQIMIDSDLDVLGRRDYMARNLDLRNELAYCCFDLTDQQWLEDQYAFITRHAYYTTCAQAMRNDGKQRNISVVQNLLARSQISLESSALISHD